MGGARYSFCGPPGEDQRWQVGQEALAPEARLEQEAQTLAAAPFCSLVPLRFHYGGITLPAYLKRRGRGAAGCRRSGEALRPEDDLVKGIDREAVRLARPGQAQS